jgi:hypothetical protein
VRNTFASPDRRTRGEKCRGKQEPWIRWAAGAEFRYVDLGKTNVASKGITNFSNCVSQGYRGEFSNTLKLGLVGLSYKF